MSTPTESTRTISIPVSAATHVVVGILIALIAITAFWANSQLPHSNDYRGTAIGIGVVGAFSAIAYWLKCDLQRGRIERHDIADTLDATAREAREREGRLLAVLERIDANLVENRGAIKKIADAVDVNTAAIKELREAVGANTETVAENTGAVEALQDCYREEGKAPDFD